MRTVRWPGKQANAEVLWSLETGRYAELGRETLQRLDEPRMAPVRARLERLGLIEGGLHLHDRVVVRSHATLLLPDRPALWMPVPSQHGAGGLAYTALAISEEEVALWRGINGSRSVADLAVHLGWDTEATLEALQRFTTPDMQLVQLRAQRPRTIDPSMLRPLTTGRRDHARTDDQRGDEGETTLTTYHLHHITDGSTHFDDRETTVAHALALPHAALEHEPFGQRLRSQLSERGFDFTGQVVEIGCGTGELAGAVTSTPTGPYLRVDLSPELLRTQATRAPDTVGILADGTRLPLRENIADVVLSNEVIADLSAVPVDLSEAPSTGAGAEVARLVDAHDLSPLEGDGPYNLGAWQLLLEIDRLLAPGGRAYISEFGALDANPEEARQLDHPEVSIHFGHLEQLASSLGLSSEVVPLGDLLRFDPSARHLARPIWMAARALARSHGVHLEARSWDEHTVLPQLPETVEGLWSWPVTSPGPGPLITRFYGLLVHKPEAAASIAR